MADSDHLRINIPRAEKIAGMLKSMATTIRSQKAPVEEQAQIRGMVQHALDEYIPAAGAAPAPPPAEVTIEGTPEPAVSADAPGWTPTAVEPPSTGKIMMLACKMRAIDRATLMTRLAETLEHDIRELRT